MNPLTRPRSSATLSPKGERATIPVSNPLPLGGEGGERSEPGEGVLHLSPYFARLSKQGSCLAWPPLLTRFYLTRESPERIM